MEYNHKILSWSTLMFQCQNSLPLLCTLLVWFGLQIVQCPKCRDKVFLPNDHIQQKGPDYSRTPSKGNVILLMLVCQVPVVQFVLSRQRMKDQHDPWKHQNQMKSRLQGDVQASTDILHFTCRRTWTIRVTLVCAADLWTSTLTTCFFWHVDRIIVLTLTLIIVTLFRSVKVWWKQMTLIVW